MELKQRFVNALLMMLFLSESLYINGGISISDFDYSDLLVLPPFRDELR